ncbi:MAG: hypothetical protein QXT26_07230, partial [Thermoproteota archaeon]
SFVTPAFKLALIISSIESQPLILCSASIGTLTSLQGFLKRLKYEKKGGFAGEISSYPWVHTPRQPQFWCP